MIEAVLFDLDGTLVDTAPDMGGALINLMLEEGMEPLPLDAIRPYVSQGGLVLTRMGFEGKVPEAEIEPLRQRFLQHYHAIVANQSKLFDGYEAILGELEAASTPWGIVTNKPEWLTHPLLEQLGLSQRAGVVIGGDTLEHRKPHPLPLQVAAERLRVDCGNCVYVGDDERDIIAARAAGMKSLVAAYGYIEDGVSIEAWNADGLIGRPADLLQHPLLTNR
ncbi:MAG: phosphoglycolate phosphatase [Gammaproteobacteria bacterium]|nr:phosphoglycolate phosphatase [Gammaproteobacteria bacterium]